MNCWFCRKGRHWDCMKWIPIEDWEQDCSFNVTKTKCECNH